MSDHRSLYKSTAPEASDSVARRRRRLLDDQKSQRQRATDDQRPRVQQILDDLLTSSTDDTTYQATGSKPNHNKSRQQNHRNPSGRYKNHLQLSEWLRERPDDLHNWTMVVCPRGRRCLVVAHDGRTSVYGKNGGFVRKFRSALPGDRGGNASQDCVTILDCVQTPDDGLWVLDVLAYGRHDFTDCDVAFRFFWLRNQCAEGAFADGDDASWEGDAADRLRPALRAACADGEELAEILSRFPMYGAENRPPVDGLLFYHNESVYVHGSTPLVGWLFPYMCAEVLGDGWTAVHAEWETQRPDGYVNAIAYMERFDAELKGRRNNKRRGGGVAKRQSRTAMDVDAEQNGDELEECVDMDADRCLEETGECVDDVYYENVKQQDSK